MKERKHKSMTGIGASLTPNYRERKKGGKERRTATNAIFL